jgi:hypothetical protein
VIRHAGVPWLQLEYMSRCSAGRVSGAIVLGCWLTASPFLFSYSGEHQYCRFGTPCCGGWSWCSARCELWQDWRLSDQDLSPTIRNDMAQSDLPALAGLAGP